ncbi:ATP-binding protein [Streptomyces sp. CA-210063]|uniref:AAA family ATPase n=1 Tax=Streptomyces sp. CA-210063 TaxID=2801029 RepID=UPI00214BDB4C|nr:ATP-binding protein [Streptomyces sp. CA-210063]UUU33122.1 ATP-binding protein [Streptomyces sp. CA-210063]
MQHPGLPGKPSHVFDRAAEWKGLTAFAGRPLPHAMLGIVSGRRRMGKTYLLRALVEERGGFYFGATAGTEAESLRQFSAALADHARSPVPFSFATWSDAVSYLFGLAAPDRGGGLDRGGALDRGGGLDRGGALDREGAPGRESVGSSATSGAPFLVVIDEFPYLAKVAPELPSLIQREIDRFQVERSHMRLLLCGSAMSVMGGLLASTAPLRGRAQLELVVRPFGYRAAADFWGVTAEPALAARLHAVLGGTPAYRRQFLADDVPASLGDFDDWICRTVLSPFSPLFREARYLLAEEADIRDTALYHSVLAAVAQGNTTRGGIAGYIGRKSVDISHPLNVLEDSHLLAREADIFRAGKSQYRITEPLITFYEAVMRPSWARLESGQAAEVWAGSAERFAAQVAGPHFEGMCREYVLGPGRSLLRTSLGEIGGGVVSDPKARRQIQVDVAAVEQGSGGSRPTVALLGEAKWGTVMGLGHLERLRRAGELLTARGMDTEDCLLACFSAAGFSDALRAEAKQGGVALVGLEELYGAGGDRYEVGTDAAAGR